MTRLRSVVLAIALGGCSAPRFSLRPVLAHDDDARTLAHRPATRDSAPIATTLDQLVLRPIAHGLLFEPETEARNVNALDEVPDSTWFTNRSLTPAEAAIGPCRNHAAPRAPFSVRSAKIGGTTPGLMVRDADGHRFLVKIDPYPRDLPELNTAADAIVTRIYWAAGFNTPCNTVQSVRAADFRVREDAYYNDDLGRRRHFDPVRLPQLLALGVRRPDGTTRVSFSAFVEGEPIGPWAVEGVRDDDANDRIPHEHRRELRGERLLAAWVNHWDSREQNSLDTFVRTDRDRGYVRHWFIDFSDALGSRSADLQVARRLGYQTYVAFGAVLEDIAAFGMLRRPWDDASIDPRAPNLGYFGARSFDPIAWTPVAPLPRFEAARTEDLAWMARVIARITPEHIRAMVAEGHFSSAATETRLVEILVARRQRILDWAFENSSPLTDVEVRGETLCATDLAVENAGTPPAVPRYATEFHRGARAVSGGGASTPTAIADRETVGRICFALPSHAVNDSVRTDDPSAYVIVDVIRAIAGRRSGLRAHLYDLGPARGYRLAGIERP